jgi:tryptophan synthase beta chain
MNTESRILLNGSDLPRFWYNINADNPGRPGNPVLHPQHQRARYTRFSLSALFPMELIIQEISTERYIRDPGRGPRNLYQLWRPTPLIRARRLEKALDTPAHIYYKTREAFRRLAVTNQTLPLPRLTIIKLAGTRALTTETGAGQWGSAFAMACNFFNLDLEVYMVKVSYDQKPYRRFLHGDFWRPSLRLAQPTTPNTGRAVLVENPDSAWFVRDRHLRSSRDGSCIRRLQEI